MDATPLPEYDERRRMAARLWVAGPWLLVLSLASAPVLHQVGLSGLLLVLGPALGGLLLTLAVVLQARQLPRGPDVTLTAPGDPARPLIPPQTV